MPPIEDTYYLGPEAARLFGAWHPPDPSAARTTGIVVCPAISQEALRGHLLCRRLAVVLSGCGYPVMRFDYFGTGDSHGESHEATTDQWLDDIDTVVEEMSRRSGCSGICLIGLRFGATLAVLYGSLRRRVHAIVGLDPLTNGSTYISDLRQLEEEDWKTLGDLPAARLAAEQDRGLGGMAYSDRFLADLAGVELATLEERPADHIGLFDDGAVGPRVAALKEAPAFVEGFDHLDIGTDTQTVFEDFIWPPGQAPRKVSDWVLATCP